MAKEYHVSLVESDGRWGISRENADRPFAFYKNAEAAESAARVLAHQNEGIVVVHDPDGGTRRTDHRGKPLAA